MDICIVPAWRRPEFLTICLERLTAATAHASTPPLVIIALDRGADDDCRVVAQSWAYERKVIMPMPAHGYYGSSYAFLEAYRFALDTAERCGAERVYCVEEDVWVADDFFATTEQLHAEYRPGAISLCKCHNDGCGAFDTEPITVTPDPTRFFDHPYYQSIGSSLSVEMLRYVIRHAAEEYYVDPSRYVIERFPSSRWRDRRWEQDGLIDRVLESFNHRTVYASTPRAFHAGFYGYNRIGIALTGTLAERVAALRAMTAEQMNEAAQQYKDIEPCDLSGHFAATVVLES